MLLRSHLKVVSTHVALILFTLGNLEAQELPIIRTTKEVTILDEVEVRTDDAEDDFDITGMGYLEAELRDPPFSNNLLGADEASEDLGAELDDELSQIVVDSPADLVAGSDRLNLRGFPTPRLRNAFVQTGIPEILGVRRRETIQGPLTPVTGRAAPGGIQNYMTARPPGRAVRRYSADISTNNQVKGSIENGGPIGNIGDTRFYHRVAIGYDQRRGPQQFAEQETTTISAALTARHSRAHSTMWQVDLANYDGNPTPGVPEYRATPQGPILGRYLPLADFHAYGPNAGIKRRSGSASIQYEGQPTGNLSLRGVIQGVWREINEERFTRGDYVLSLERFAGNREPQYVEQPLSALAMDTGATWRFQALKADHKFSVSVDAIKTDYSRLQRGLTAQERSALPLSARRFDPLSPDYFRPELTPESYQRITTDRNEDTTYIGTSISERAAFADGRLVATIGTRLDQVRLDLTDNRANAQTPQVIGKTNELTYHAGGNWIIIPGRILGYANTSTAFEPSTRVDSRTGQIQGNETTGGIEIGFRGEEWERRLRYTLHAFAFTNENISRRNPLYRDPIADADQTQPALVSAGQENFQGATLEVRLQASKGLQLRGKAVFTDATTEKSPDLPAEVGRAIARVPRWTSALSSQYRWTEGKLNGWSLIASLIYVSDYVDTYEDARRALVEYPGYTYTSLSLGYRWKKAKATNSVSLRFRNIFNENLLTRISRPGSEPSASLSFRRSL